MKNKNSFILTILVLTGLLRFNVTQAQAVSSEISPFKVTADLVSSYVWRGVEAVSPSGAISPNFQPTFSYTIKNLEIGAWGSTDFTGFYKEVDLYAAYTAGVLKFTLTDYNWNFATTKYFTYKKDKTGHIFEGSIGYTGPSSMPLSITANVMFAGADKKYATDITKQNYSTYIEFGYAYKYFSPFIGITPFDGYYGDSYGGYGGFSVCNLGITSTRNLKISDNFSLPLKATLGFNPQKEDAYLVFGITF